MKSRRRFLIDLVCLGGVLGAASQLQPFFGHFLEGQDKPARPPESPPSASASPTPQPDVTEAYPSDSDLHVTQAYPSDSDMQGVTKAYPSDSDMHIAPVKPSTPAPKPGKTSLLPFWAHFS